MISQETKQSLIRASVIGLFIFLAFGLFAGRVLYDHERQLDALRQF